MRVNWGQSAIGSRGKTRGKFVQRFFPDKKKFEISKKSG